jgi:hypothetical protein
LLPNTPVSSAMNKLRFHVFFAAATIHFLRLRAADSHFADERRRQLAAFISAFCRQQTPLFRFRASDSASFRAMITTPLRSSFAIR